MKSQDAKQIKRLFDLPFAATNQPGDEAATRVKGEFGRVIERAECSGVWLEAVVDRLMATAQRFPPPAELATAIEDTPRPETQKAPMGCDDCHGSGWHHFTQRVKTAAGSYEADVCQFCHCSLGQWKRAAEQARKTKSEERARSRAIA
jgi:hypothetical protein